MTLVNDANTRLFNNRDQHAMAKREMADDYQRAMERQKASYENRINKLQENNKEELNDVENDYEVKISGLNNSHDSELKELKEQFRNDKNDTISTYQNKMNSNSQKNREQLLAAERDYQRNKESEVTRLKQNGDQASKNYRSDLARFQDQAARKERMLTDEYNRNLYDREREVQNGLESNANDYRNKLAQASAQAVEEKNRERLECSEENQNIKNNLLDQQASLRNDLQHKLRLQNESSMSSSEGLTAKSNNRLNQMQSVFIEEKKGIIEHSKRQMDQHAESIKGEYAKRFDTLNEDFSKRLQQQELENRSLREQFRNKVETMEKVNLQQLQQYKISSERQMEIEKNNMQERLRTEMAEHDMQLNKERSLHRELVAQMKEENDRRLTDVVNRYETELRTKKADHDSEMQKALISFNERLDKTVKESTDVRENIVAVYEDRLESMREKMSYTHRANA